MSGQITVTGFAAGLMSGQKIIGPITTVGAGTVGTILDLTVLTGDNTIVIPTGAVVALFAIGSGASTLKVRTSLNPTDAGLPLGPNGPLMLPLPAGATSLIVNATVGGSVIEVSFI